MSGKAVSLFMSWCSQLVTLVIVRSMVAGYYVDESIELDMIGTKYEGALTNYVDKKMI
jgi:hypothetical protein